MASLKFASLTRRGEQKDATNKTKEHYPVVITECEEKTKQQKNEVLQVDRKQSAITAITNRFKLDEEYPDLENFVISPKNSDSNSIIFQAELGVFPIILKVTFLFLRDNENYRSSSAYTESELYTFIEEKVSLHTPHTASLLYRRKSQLKGFRDTYGQQLDQEFEIQMFDIAARERKEITDDTIVIITCTQLLKEITLSELTYNSESKTKINLADFTSRAGDSSGLLFNTNVPNAQDNQLIFVQDVLFQIAYTLAVFQRFGIMHNDLHPGNVFVQKLTQPILLSYKISDAITVERQVLYFVYVYDFDHGCKIPTKVDQTRIENQMLEKDLFCKQAGECNKFSKNFDWYNVVWHLFQSPVLTDHTKNHIRTIFSKMYIEKKAISRFIPTTLGDLSHSGHMCFCGDLGCKSCKIPDKKEQKDNVKLSPEKYLQEYHPKKNYEQSRGMETPTKTCAWKYALPFKASILTKVKTLFS